jgi:hypothetical protein
VIELIAETPEGRFTLDHVMPPSALDHAGAGSLSNDKPPTVQSTPLEHEIALSVHDPAGVATEFHVVPPSVVTTSNAALAGAVAPSGFAPIATQSDADEHDTERSTPVPPSTNCWLQDWPPSLLTRICAPTATQNEELGQSTEPRAPTSFGSVGTFQVTPLSLENSNWPP